MCYVGSNAENTVTIVFILGFLDPINYFHAIKIELGW